MKKETLWNWEASTRIQALALHVVNHDRILNPLSTRHHFLAQYFGALLGVTQLTYYTHSFCHLVFLLTPVSLCVKSWV